MREKINAARLALNESLGSSLLWSETSFGRRTSRAISIQAGFGPCLGWYRPGSEAIRLEALRARGSFIESTSLNLSIPRKCSRGTELMILSIFSRIPLGSLRRLDWFSNLIFIIWSSMTACRGRNHLFDIFREDNLILQISKGQMLRGTGLESDNKSYVYCLPCASSYIHISDVLLNARQRP